MASSAALSPVRADYRAAAKGAPHRVALTSPSIQVSVEAIVLNWDECKGNDYIGFINIELRKCERALEAA